MEGTSDNTVKRIPERWNYWRDKVQDKIKKISWIAMELHSRGIKLRNTVDPRFVIICMECDFCHIEQDRSSYYTQKCDNNSDHNCVYASFIEEKLWPIFEEIYIKAAGGEELDYEDYRKMAKKNQGFAFYL